MIVKTLFEHIIMVILHFLVKNVVLIKNSFKSNQLCCYRYPQLTVHNRCVIDDFGCVFVLSRCFLDFSVGIGVFVIGLSQISLFSQNYRSFTETTVIGTENILRKFELNQIIFSRFYSYWKF